MHPDNFHPIPKVYSAVIKIVRNNTRNLDCNHNDFMTRPSLESQISTDTSTHDVGLVTSTPPSGIGVANITTLNTTQRFSNAHSSTNSISGLNIDANSTIYQNMDSILDPGSNYLNLGVNNSGGVGPSRDFNTSNFYITDQSRPSVWQDDQFVNFTKSETLNSSARLDIRRFNFS